MWVHLIGNDCGKAHKLITYLSLSCVYILIATAETHYTSWTSNDHDNESSNNSPVVMAVVETAMIIELLLSIFTMLHTHTINQVL